MKLTKLVPWIACGLALVGALVALVPPGKPRGFDVDAFARLPVLEGGRVKPVDSVARNSLLMIRGQQSFRHGGYTVGADEWLLDLLFRPRVADAQPVFVINDPEVLGLANSKTTGDDVLRIIYRSRDWTRQHTIKLALVKNPKVPLAVTMRFMTTLHESEIKALASDKSVPSAVRINAKKMLDKKS